MRKKEQEGLPEVSPLQRSIDMFMWETCYLLYCVSFSHLVGYRQMRNFNNVFIALQRDHGKLQK